MSPLSRFVLPTSLCPSCPCLICPQLVTPVSSSPVPLHLLSLFLPSASHAAPGSFEMSPFPSTSCAFTSRDPSSLAGLPLPLRLFSHPSQDPPQSLFFFSFSLKATWGSENGRFQSQQAIAYVTLTVTSESETLSSYVTLVDGCPVPPQRRKGWEEEEATGPHPPRSSFTSTSA